MAKLTVILLCIFFTHVARAEGQWPRITDASKSIIVAHADDPAEAALEMAITGNDGKALYDLQCHSGDYDSNEPNYSGLIQCYLFPTNERENLRNLLDDSREERRNWQNRGRFLAFHLEPGCSSYPDWGATRRFKLRGMELTLSVTDIKFVPNPQKSAAPLAQSYKFKASAKAISDASSDIAEAASSPEPPWFYATACKAR